MNQEDNKKKFIQILNEAAQERRQKARKDLAEHKFDWQTVQEKASLFDTLVFRAIMEQTDNLSLVFGKPHQFQLAEAKEILLAKETYDAMEKSAILRPARLGPLTLIG